MHDSHTLLTDCPECDGTGKIKLNPQSNETGDIHYRRCTACNGMGTIETTWERFEEMQEKQRQNDEK